MKKIICTVCACFVLTALQVQASGGWGYKYTDAGGIYTGTSFPQSVSKNIDISQENLAKLKKGESSAQNILQLIEIGDASINKAAQNANITKVHYVDTKVSKVYIPLGFIPIYAKETKTIVYGE